MQRTSGLLRASVESFRPCGAPPSKATTPRRPWKVVRAGSAERNVGTFLSTDQSRRTPAVLHGESKWPTSWSTNGEYCPESLAVDGRPWPPSSTNWTTWPQLDIRLRFPKTVFTVYRRRRRTISEAATPIVRQTRSGTVTEPCSRCEVMLRLTLAAMVSERVATSCHVEPAHRSS